MTAKPEAATTKRARRPRGWLRSLWRWSAIGFGVVAVTLALAIGLFRVVVPLVPDFHNRIEAAAGQALGLPVEFERLDVRWRWRGPELVFYGATVFDAAVGETLLQAREGHVNLNVGKFVFSRTVVPDFVVLRGLDIEIHQDAQGRFSVLGRQARTSDAPAGTANWPLPDGRYVLREAQVRYSREGAAPLSVPRVDVNVDVDGKRLRVDGSIVPPEGMGNALDLSAEFDGGMAAARALQWQAYVAGSNLDVSALNELLGRYALPFESGQADIVAWASFHGLTIQTASLDLNVTDLLTVAAVPAETYRHLSGRFELDRTPLGWRVRAHDFLIDRGDRPWPPVNASITCDEGVGGEQRWHVIVPFARLDDLAPLIAALPDNPVVSAVREHVPEGDLFDLDAIVRVGADGAPKAVISGRFAGLGWNAAGKLPGLRGLSGSVRSDEFGGRLDLETDAFTINAPAVFADALQAWRLTGSLSWREQADGWHFVSDNVLLATEDFDALAQVELQTHADGSSPHLLVNADLGDVDIVRALTYLPVHLMKPKLVDWLYNALRGGTARSASVNIDGALDRFPYSQPTDEGSFQALLEIDDLALAFAKDWPVATAIDSQVRFEGSTLRATVSDGLFGATRIDTGQVVIDDFKDVVLDIDVVSTSPLEHLRDYFITTPAAQRYAGLLSDMQPSGAASTGLSITMPLKTWRTFDYQLEISAEGAQLDYRDWPVPLEDIRGNVVLSRAGLAAPAVTGVLLGRPVAIDVATVPIALGDAQQSLPSRFVQVRASGRTDANMLAERIYAPLGDMLRGGAQWQATIDFPPLDQPDALPTTLTLTSALEDLAVRLPAPLAKDAGSTRNLIAQMVFRAQAQPQLKLTLGEEVVATLALDPQQRGAHVTRGTVALNGGDAELSDRDGVEIHGSLPAFDYDAWLAFASRSESQMGNILRTANVRLDQLTVFGQTLRNARVMVDRNVREWLIEIESDEVSGAVFVPFDFRASGDPVIANLQNLTWITLGDDSPGIDPRTLPALRVDTQSFVFNDMRFGALSAQIGQVEDGLQVERMTTEAPSFTSTAGGTWRYAGGAPSEFKMEFRSTDVKSTLEALGTVGAIDAGEATFTLDLHWDDELGSGFMSDVYGDVTVAVGDGQLLAVDPKAGRVFGLISLTALPRRLGLDFRDIFKKGFAFDAIEGDFSLRGGNAFTDNLTLRGPAAQVAVVGRAGIVARDYDQTASVYASFGSSLPIAGAIAGGPAVGAALLIFSELFKDPLKQIGRVDYRISGSWEAPEVSRIVATSEPATAPQELPDAPPSEPAGDDGATIGEGASD